MPGEMARGARRVVRRPLRALGQLREGLANVGATTLAGINAPAPPSPLNVDIGPHRRYTWVDADLARFKAIKDSLGGTLNDVVLAAVSLALGRWLRAHDHPTEGLVLKAMVPVSVRADVERGALGNRVAAMWAPLPVGIEDPAACYEQIRVAMDDLKHSGQAVGAQVLTNLAGFAPPTILSQAARLQARQRYFNLVVTNVPGPQFPLYLLGRRLRSLYPVVPLARRQALGIAVMSYNGHLGFGLLGDYDALPDLDTIAQELDRAIRRLARAANPPKASRRGPPSGPPRNGPPRAALVRRRPPHRHPQTAPTQQPRRQSRQPHPHRRPGRGCQALVRLALCQMNATVGDIAGNAQRIRAGVEAARAQGAQLVLFPELALTGYPPEDLLLREHFLDDTAAALRELAAGVEGIVAVVGYPGVGESTRSARLRGRRPRRRRSSRRARSSSAPRRRRACTTPPRCSPTAACARSTARCTSPTTASSTSSATSRRATRAR